MATSFTSFLAFFQAHQLELVRAISTDLKSQVSFYTNLPDVAVQRSADGALTTLIEGWQAQNVTTMVNITVRGVLGGVKYGLRLDEALHILSIFRFYLNQLTLEALQKRIPDADKGLIFYNQAFDQSVERVGGFYYDQLQDSQDTVMLFRLVVENAQDAVVMFGYDGVLTYANPATLPLLGVSNQDDVIGKRVGTFFNSTDRRHFRFHVMPVILDQGAWHGQMWIQRPHGGKVLCDIVCFLVRDQDQQVSTISAIVRDITQEYESQQQREAENQAILDMQSQMLAELAAPTIPLTKQSLLVPIIGMLDEQRMQHITQTMLHVVSRQRASSVIVDITGVPMMNASGGKGLMETAQAIQLLGARLIITGIHPDVAQTLISLGIDFSNITTRASLQDGIAMVLRNKEQRT